MGVKELKAKKSLGQNFLIDNNIINKIVVEINAEENDLIIEIGPGRGALTKLLKEKKSFLICYELDTDLKPFLDILEDNKTRIIYQDILKSNIINDVKNIEYKSLFIVGNLPYYITTPIIEHLINSNLKFNKLTIMVQKEVADRFLAKPRTKEYGYFTVLLDYYFNIKRVCNVSKKSFSPIPKVDSSVLSLIPKEQIVSLDTSKYFDFIKQCFSQKRKTLKNNLSNYNWKIIKEVLSEYNYDELVRAEEITQDVFINIYKKLFE